jgi:hypothetical protein
LLAHLSRLLRHPDLAVRVVPLPPLASEGHDRRNLAIACRQTIADALGIMDPGPEPVRPKPSTSDAVAAAARVPVRASR